MKKVISILISLLLLASAFGVGTIMATDPKADCCDPVNYFLSKTSVEAGEQFTLTVNSNICTDLLIKSSQEVQYFTAKDLGNGWWEHTLQANKSGKVILELGADCPFPTFLTIRVLDLCSSGKGDGYYNFSRTEVKVGDQFTLTTLGDWFPTCHLAGINGLPYYMSDLVQPISYTSVGEFKEFEFKAFWPGTANFILIYDELDSGQTVGCYIEGPIRITPKQLPMQQIMIILGIGGLMRE